MGTWRGGWWIEGGGKEEVGGGCYWVDPTSPPPSPPPRPEPSSKIEMDFGVIRRSESFGEERERDRLLERA